MNVVIKHDGLRILEVSVLVLARLDELVVRTVLTPSLLYNTD